MKHQNSNNNVNGVIEWTNSIQFNSMNEHVWRGLVWNVLIFQSFFSLNPLFVYDISALGVQIWEKTLLSFEVCDAVSF